MTSRSVVQASIEAFEWRDAFLQAVAGVLRLCERFDAYLEAHTEEPQCAADPDDAGETPRFPAVPDDPILLAVLGAVALRRSIGVHAARLPVAPPTPKSAPESSSALCGLLR
jgi:hypothetical protein